MPEQRLPFNFTDEIFVHNESQSEPLTVQVDVRLGGGVDLGRLRDAVARALAKHPRARARLAPWEPYGRGFEWIIDERAMDDPVTVLSASGEDVEETRARFYGTPISFQRSPQVRVLLLRSPGGDRILLSVHHACGDGVGALRFLRSIARAYDRRDDPVPEAVPVTLEPDPREILGGLFSWRGMATDAAWNLLRLVPPTRIAAAHDDPSPGYGIVTLRRSAADLRASPLRRGGVTVNDLLLAGLHLAVDRWNADHGIGSDHIAIYMPMNARPEQWRDEILGNFLTAERISTASTHRTSRAAAVDAISAQTRRAKERLASVLIPTAAAASMGAPIAVRTALGKVLPSAIDRFADTAVLSNLGGFDRADLRFGADLPATELHFSPPARMPTGSSVGACRLGDDLFLSLRYCHAQFTPDAGRAFADRYLAELDALAKG